MSTGQGAQHGADRNTSELLKAADWGMDRALASGESSRNEVVNITASDCPMFTSRRGSTGTPLPIVPPSTWMARFASTSFTFMSVS